MWDEDPRYQEELNRFFVRSMLVLIPLAVISFIVTGDWDSLFKLGLIIAVACGAVAIYGAVVWTIGMLIRLAVKKSQRRADGSAAK
jgi:hypothetical protein